MQLTIPWLGAEDQKEAMTIKVIIPYWRVRKPRTPRNPENRI